MTRDRRQSTTGSRNGETGHLSIQNRDFTDFVTVFVLYYVVTRDDDELSEIIGIYRTESDASDAATRAAHSPRFLQAQGVFEIGQSIVDKENWADGYVTWVPDDA